MARIEDQLPEPQARFKLDSPMSPALRDLDADQLDVMQSVYNFGRVEAVLDESVLSDLETYQAILYLIRNGYIREDRK